MQILLIEPDRVLAAAYQQALTPIGAVTTASDGQQAIEAIDQLGLVDLIIMELQLPGLNGIAFLQELRSYADTQQTPVVVQSYMRPPVADELDVITEAFGVREWLYKPQTSLQQLQKLAQTYQVLA